MASQPQAVVIGDGLQLRPWTVDDVPVLVGAYADPDIQRWHTRTLDEGEARAWVAASARRWAEEAGAEWAITTEGEVVGRIGLRTTELTEGWAEISYWVLANARGAGVAARALVALTDWALDELGLHRLEVAHSVHNPASCAVATRAGYALEGTKRRQGLHADGWHDMHLHAVIAETTS